MPIVSSLTNFTFSFILSFQKSQSWYNVSISVFFLLVHVEREGHGHGRGHGQDVKRGVQSGCCGPEQIEGPRRVVFSSDQSCPTSKTRYSGDFV